MAQGTSPIASQPPSGFYHPSKECGRRPKVSDDHRLAKLVDAKIRRIYTELVSNVFKRVSNIPHPIEFVPSDISIGVPMRRDTPPTVSFEMSSLHGAGRERVSETVESYRECA